jgi:hypothetical protein
MCDRVATWQGPCEGRFKVDSDNLSAAICTVSITLCHEVNMMHRSLVLDGIALSTNIWKPEISTASAEGRAQIDCDARPLYGNHPTASCTADHHADSEHIADQPAAQ